MLPGDVARCGGRLDVLTGEWPRPCSDCARRLSPPVGDYQVWTAPPEFEEGQCPLRIEEESK
jgi:hypothetical protein